MIQTESVHMVACGSPDIITIQAEQSVSRAAEVMDEYHIGALIVMRVEMVVGIVSERDITSKVVARNLEPACMPVERIMTRNVVYCSMDTPIATAQQIMAEHGIRHLPLIDQGLPVGMLSARDVLSHQLTAAQALAGKQGRILNELEGAFPGITALHKDSSGRILL
jgi:CBS domain-containing protein